MKKILIPTDGSEYSIRAVETGKQYAEAMGAGVVLLNVIDSAIPSNYVIPTRFNYQDFARDLEGESQKVLERAKAILGDLPTETVVENGNAARKISDYANENNVDLIIMGSHGQGSTMQRIFVGSVTAKVLAHAEPPVLVIK